MSLHLVVRLGLPSQSYEKKENYRTQFLKKDLVIFSLICTFAP